MISRFKPGQSGNPAGRKKGVKNKIALPLKEQLVDFLNDKIQELPLIWDKLSPRDRATMLKDLYPYFLPKMESVSFDFNLSRLTDDQVSELISRTFKTKDDVEKSQGT
jgi:hypothetical protein